jgi:hypothetical protein
MHPILWRLRFAVRRPEREQVREFILARMPHGGVVAEIGVDLGDFSVKILKVNRPRALHLIDPWAAEGGEYGQFAGAGRASAAGAARALKAPERYDFVRQRLAREIASGQAIIHRGDSRVVAATFADASLDWVYIDGNHSYEYVKADLEGYFPKVRPGGYIVCDDYHYAGFWNDGVTRAVDEFVAAGAVQPIFKRRSQFVMRKR